MSAWRLSDPGLPTNGTPRHPQLALGSSGQNAVVWDEQTGGARRVVLGCGVGDEKHVRLARVSITEDRGTYPAIASLADDAVMVWTSGPVESSVLRIARAGAR